MSPTRLSDEAAEVLRRVGWHPDRNVSNEAVRWVEKLTAIGHRPNAAAAKALTEFGGLRVEQRATGITLARETFEFDPLLGADELDRLQYYGRAVGREIFPLGECGDGTCILAMSPDGVVFAVGDFITEIGRDIYEAVDNLIVGRRGTTIESRRNL